MTTIETDAPRKVLVIDDNPVILKALCSVLTIHGFEVMVALDGAEVVQGMRMEKPDIILLDIMFPPSLAEGNTVWDGFDILKWLRGMGNGADIPVIIISSCDPKQYRDRCLTAGAQAYFSKPLPMRELLKTMKALLEEPVQRFQSTGDHIQSFFAV